MGTRSSNDWSVQVGDDDSDDAADDALLRAPLVIDDVDDDGIDFSDLGFDMQDAEPNRCDSTNSTIEARLSLPAPQPAHVSAPDTSLPTDTERAPSPHRQSSTRRMSLNSPQASVGPVCTQIDVYIQMALYEGNSLRFWLDQRTTLDAVEATRIFIQIVAGLKYIHKGLVHRDIKPANIFLTKGSCVVKIGDFGLAKNTVESSLRIPPSQYFFDALDTDSSSAVSVSSAGDPHSSSGDASSFGNTCSAGVGTPMYSSPEQTRGNFECDASTDVYSLGVLLCELFCVFSTQMERIVVLTAARKGDVPASIEAHHFDVARLIQRMLQEDRSKRPTCAEIERSEFFHRLYSDTQKHNFGAAPYSGRTDSSSSSSQRNEQTSAALSSITHDALEPVSRPLAPPVQIRTATRSAMVALFSPASNASNTKQSGETSARSSSSSGTRTAQRLLQEIVKLEDDEEAVFRQLSSGSSGSSSTELVAKVRSIQKERRVRLASALDALAGGIANE